MTENDCDGMKKKVGGRFVDRNENIVPLHCRKKDGKRRAGQGGKSF